MTQYFSSNVQLSIFSKSVFSLVFIRGTNSLRLNHGNLLRKAHKLSAKKTNTLIGKWPQSAADLSFFIEGPNVGQDEQGHAD